MFVSLLLISSAADTTGAVVKMAKDAMVESSWMNFMLLVVIVIVVYLYMLLFACCAFVVEFMSTRGECKDERLQPSNRSSNRSKSTDTMLLIKL